MKNLLYVAIDVDDNSYNVGCYCPESSWSTHFRGKPEGAALVKELRKLQKKNYHIKTCHEATYVGYSLHRYLENKGIASMVVAPSLIPVIPGKKVKTDRLDCLKLARDYAVGLLTAVHVPDKQDEMVRGLIRTRTSLVRKRASLKREILSIMRQHGFNYKQETSSKCYWTTRHLAWLKKKLRGGDETLVFIIEVRLTQCDLLSAQIEECDTRIAHFAETERYKKRKDSLCCFRGIATLSAMTLIVEIGDIRRFSHPERLTSYAGLSIKEYSSGGKEKKFGITKAGNGYIRTVAVEACQRLSVGYRVGKDLKARRRGQGEEIIAIADKCGRRLRKRYLHLLRLAFCRFLAPRASISTKPRLRVRESFYVLLGQH